LGIVRIEKSAIYIADDKFFDINMGSVDPSGAEIYWVIYWVVQGDK
jgi:hypothetical protein